MSCDWNYRPDHCIYTKVCKEAEKHGVAIIHGNRGVFLSDKQPTFKAVYSAFQHHNLEIDTLNDLIKRLKLNLEPTSDTNCGKSWKSIILGLK